MSVSLDQLGINVGIAGFGYGITWGNARMRFSLRTEVTLENSLTRCDALCPITFVRENITAYRYLRNYIVLISFWPQLLQL